LVDLQNNNFGHFNNMLHRNWLADFRWYAGTDWQNFPCYAERDWQIFCSTPKQIGRFSVLRRNRLADFLCYAGTDWQL